MARFSNLDTENKTTRIGTQRAMTIQIEKHAIARFVVHNLISFWNTPSTKEFQSQSTRCRHAFCRKFNFHLMKFRVDCECVRVCVYVSVCPTAWVNASIQFLIKAYATKIRFGRNTVFFYYFVLKNHLLLLRTQFFRLFRNVAFKSIGMWPKIAEKERYIK